MTGSLVHYLEELPHRSVLTSVSALDTYYNLPEARTLRVSTEADLVELTKAYGELEFLGIDGVDAGLRRPEGYILFSCVDSVVKLPRSAFSVANFAYDPAAMIYLDKSGAYPDLKAKRTTMSNGFVSSGTWKILAEAAVLLSRYDFTVEEGLDLERLVPGEFAQPLLTFEQRILLEELLAGKNAKEGFRLLRRTGFVDLHWPDLAATYEITHSKEHHPEGNVWCSSPGGVSAPCLEWFPQLAQGTCHRLPDGSSLGSVGKGLTMVDLVEDRGYL
jgi:poly(A) polymerase